MVKKQKICFIIIWKAHIIISCVHCGLRLCAQNREYIVSASYIDKDIIGKNPSDVETNEMVKTKNENIIEIGTFVIG